MASKKTSTKQKNIGITTTLSEHKHSRSISWEEAMYPSFRDPEHTKGLLDICVDESEPPCVIGSALRDVIRANHDRPFVAYQVVCAYSSHLTVEDVRQIVDVLKGLEQSHQGYLSDLYWWLYLLEKKLVHGVKHFQLKAELLPENVPEQFTVLPEYQQWAKAMVA